MKTLIDNPPRTMMELYKGLPQGTLAEVIDNVLYMSPSPKSNHQIVLNEINFHLLQHFKINKTGMVYISPLDVYLDNDRTVVQPDLIILLNHKLHLLKEDGYIHGAPDILIEVLSDHNKDHDLILKKSLYERFGVQEYWIINSNSQLAMGFFLHSGKYVLAAEDFGTINSSLLKASFSF